MEIEPILGAEGEEDFLGDVSGKSKAHVDRMFEALLEDGDGTLKIAGGKFLFKGRGANDFVVEFDGCSGGIGGDF
jgi:hypothetical protein